MRNNTPVTSDVRMPDQAEWLNLPGCVAPPCCSGTVDIAACIGKILPDRQVTTVHTGWMAEQRERMTAHGYDGMDSIAAWYS